MMSASKPTCRPVPWLWLGLCLAACGATPEQRLPHSTELVEGELSLAQTWQALVEERRAASAPGEELARLAPLLGEWQVELEVTGASGAAGRVAQGSAEVSSELGGRFLRFDVRLEVGLQPVRSGGLLGYDTELGQYELLWFGELSSTQRIARGHGDPGRGGIHLEASIPDPGTGAVRHTRSVLRIEEPDRFTLDQWGLDHESSEWLRLLRTTYRRASPGQVSRGESTAGPGQR
jgi:hypothetical protein